jgi:23S rRNA (uracil1939-C5)-methyltransferase
VEVAVTALGEDGLGEGQFEGRYVRIRNALPGETVTARVLKRRAGALLAEAVEVRDRAPLRRAAPCTVFPRCGGCSLQHLEHGAQLRHKEKVLLDALAANGVVPQSVRRPVSGPRLHYRHKARLGVRCVGDNLLVGFRESFSSRVVRMADCRILAEPLARCLPDLQSTLSSLRERHRVPQVELVAGDDSQAVIVRHLDPLGPESQVRLEEMSRRLRMRVYLQAGGYDSLMLLGAPGKRPKLTYSIMEFGVTYRFDVADFVQVNPAINRALASSVAVALDPRPGITIADLFCGIGNFSLVLARHGAKVKGFEASAGAIERARENADLNGLEHRCEFDLADLYDSGYAIPAGTQRLLLDPPRSGAGPHLARWLSGTELERVVYVSCNPMTFASDAAVFEKQGFALIDVGVFDMFPQTAHVETLGVFVPSYSRTGASR